MSDFAFNLMQATEKIIHANEVLQQSPLQALPLYTEAAEEMHPVAFLNRSLCYLALERPDLAAMDAQKAFMLSVEARRHPIVHRHLTEYIDACVDMGGDDSAWATLPPRVLFLPDEASQLTLLKLTLNPKPASYRELPKGALGGAPNNSFTDFQTKALFRAIFALWRCGGGALRSAMTCLGRSEYRFPNVAKDEFKAIGNGVMRELEQQRFSRTYEDFSALMSSRYTFFDREWSRIEEPSSEVINAAILEIDRRARVIVFESEGQRILKPAQDIFAGDVLFLEMTVLSAFTDSTHYNCEACSATMIIPQRFTERLQRTWSDSAFRNGSGPLHSDVKVCGTCRQRIFWCSDRCRKMALNSHHVSICGLRATVAGPLGETFDPLKDQDALQEPLEEVLRLAFSSHSHHRAPNPSVRVLTAQLLLRVLSWAYFEGKRPCQHPAVRLLVASTTDHGKPNTTPWSYDTNVVAPLQILLALDAVQLKVVCNMQSGDGQVINALIDVIERQLHISSIPPWTKTYGPRGELLDMASDTQIEDAPEQVENEDPRYNTTPIPLFGKLHPLCGLLRIAPDGVSPNVELIDLGHNQVICIPLAEEVSTASENTLPAVVIRADEPLFLTSRTIRPSTEEERSCYHFDDDFGMLELSLSDETEDDEDYQEMSEGDEERPLLQRESQEEDDDEN